MTILSVVFVGLGLSMDAFAVAMVKGLNMKKISYEWSAVIATFFGLFQAVMPLLGWLLGNQFGKYIKKYDHWLALILLSLIGIKMIYDSRKSDCEGTDKKSIKELLILSIATSIDALAVGITFALIEINIFTAVIIIGVITLALSYTGILLGHRFGCKCKSYAEILGGIVLILIGIKIFIEHMII